MKYARFINENEIEELTNNYVVMDGRVYTNQGSGTFIKGADV